MRWQRWGHLPAFAHICSQPDSIQFEPFHHLLQLWYLFSSRSSTLPLPNHVWLSPLTIIVEYTHTRVAASVRILLAPKQTLRLSTTAPARTRCKPPAFRLQHCPSPRTSNQRRPTKRSQAHPRLTKSAVVVRVAAQHLKPEAGLVASCLDAEATLSSLPKLPA